jgi:hypothetical protein
MDEGRTFLPIRTPNRQIRRLVTVGVLPYHSAGRRFHRWSCRRSRVTLESVLVPVSRIRRSDPGSRGEDPTSILGAAPRGQVGRCLEVDDRLAASSRHTHLPDDPPQIQDPIAEATAARSRSWQPRATFSASSPTTRDPTD